MTKNEFFKYLDKRLSVLNEKEREDIKSEYSQHIDMKIQSGKSEEEAIKDFGDIESFVDDILSAYNVDPNYKRSHIDSDIAVKIISNGKGIFKKAFKKGKNFINKIVGFIMGNRKGGKNVESNIVESENVVNETKVTEENNIKAEETKPKKEHKSLADYDFMGFLLKIVMLCIRIGVFFTLLPYTFMLFFTIAGFGVLLVAAFTGYPAWGLAICTLGFDLCATAVFAFIVKLVYFTKFGKKEESVYEA